jgi:hypothetical protein
MGALGEEALTNRGAILAALGLSFFTQNGGQGGESSLQFKILYDLELDSKMNITLKNELF